MKKGTISLTPIEWKILSAFTRYPQKVFTRDELIASAFDTDFSGYDRVIDTHIKNLRKKIEDDPKNPIYLCTVHGIGYKFGGKYTMKQKKHKISTQLSAGFAVIVLITISVISLTANLLISHQFEKYVARQRETFAEQLITTLLSQYNSSNQTWNLDYIHGVGMYALKDGYIIKVYDKDKNIIWDAENHDMTLCHQIMKDIHTNMEKKRPGLKGSFSTYHYTLSQDNKIAGYADISYYGPYYFSESDFQFLDSLNQILFITGISSLILAVIAGMLLAKRLSVPLTKAKETAEKIADGNYQIRYGSDKANTTALELAQLGQAIDHMAENLEKQEEVRRQLT